ncbi:MAG: PD40 domain-containing protein [Bacteroidales bacterium]|nr:PD40 domain-containing protein [Bacteroidales bacterium]
MKNLFIFLMLFSSFCVSAQEYTTKSKKAIKFYEQAKSLFWDQKYAQSELIVSKAIKLDSNFVEAFTLLSGTYALRRMGEENLRTMATCVRINGMQYPSVYYHYAVELFDNGKYDEALANYQIADNNSRILTKALHQKVKAGIENTLFAIQLKNNPVPFNPVNIGANINSEWDDYLPSFTVDESYVVITSRIPAEGRQVMNGYSGQEDFYVSKKVDGAWLPRQNVGEPINTLTNEGAQSLSANGRLLVYTACERYDSYGDCDLYYTSKTGKSWSIPKNINKPINTRYWESQPSLSADGRILYFVSNKPGGYGGMDIWFSTLNEYGEWTIPTNMGEVINTDKDESSPFIHSDGRTLYFASSGHKGMGKSDIFYSRKLPDNTWQKPTNIGYPINSHEEEQDFIVNAKADLGFFSSDRFKGEGRLDVYQFELYEAARPLPVTYAKGIIFDAETKRKLEALFEIYDLHTNELLVQSLSDPRTW